MCPRPASPPPPPSRLERGLEPAPHAIASVSLAAGHARSSASRPLPRAMPDAQPCADAGLDAARSARLPSLRAPPPASLLALCTTCTRPSLHASHPTRDTLAATALCRHMPAPLNAQPPQTTPTHEPALTVKTSLSRMDWRVDCERPIVSRYCINSSACVGASCRSPEPG